MMKTVNHAIVISTVAAAMSIFTASTDAATISAGLTLRGAPVWIPPSYGTRTRSYNVPPVIEERPIKVWREPVFENRTIRVEIPAEIIRRRIERHDRRGRCIGHEYVNEVIRPARHEYRMERVLVKPGYYETIFERVVVRGATTRTVTERVVVTPGHWVYPRYTIRTGREHHEHGPIRDGHRRSRYGVRIQRND